MNVYVQNRFHEIIVALHHVSNSPSESVNHKNCYL